MEKRNTILLTIIAIATLLVTIVGATFAYFASNINTNATLNVNVNTSNEQAVFLATADGNINIEVDTYMMQENDADPSNLETSNNGDIATLLNKTANLNVSLQASENNHITTCSYDLVFIWDEASESNFSDKTNGTEKGTEDGEKYYESKYYTRSYQESMEGFKELTVEITGYYGKETDERLGSGDDLSEVNIDTFKIKDDNKIVLLEGQTISSESKTEKTIANYEVTFRFYNLTTDQSSLKGKNFSGKVMIDNVVC